MRRQDADRVEICGRYAEVASRGFSGAFTASPNEKYVVAWSQETHDYVLSRDYRVLASRELNCPSLGRVTDRGIHMLCSKALGDPQSSFLHSFSEDGSLRATLKLSYIPVEAAISEDGALGVVQLATGRFVLADFVGVRILWDRVLPSSFRRFMRATSLRIDLTHASIVASFDTSEELELGMSGEFPSKEAVDHITEQHADRDRSGSLLLGLCREIVSRPGFPKSPAEAGHVAMLAKKAISKGLAGDSIQLSEAERILSVARLALTGP